MMNADTKLPAGHRGRSCWCCRAAARWAPIRSGVYQALHEAGIEPDWVIGTSIGAINASLIAGNEPADRLERLKEFWRRVEHGPFHQALSAHAGVRQRWRRTGSPWRAASPASSSPIRWRSPASHMPLGAEAAGYYSTAPLRGDAGRAGRFRPDQPRRDRG